MKEWWQSFFVPITGEIMFSPRADISASEVDRRKFEQNVYTHSELKALLKTAGFRVKVVWGPLPGGKFETRKTWHQTILAEKPFRSF